MLRRLRQPVFSFAVKRKLEKRQVIQKTKCGHWLLNVSEYSCEKTEAEECFYVLVTVIGCLHKLLLLNCNVLLSWVILAVLEQDLSEVKCLVTVCSKYVNISSFVIQNTVKFRVRVYKMMYFHAFKSVSFMLQ